MSTLVLLPTLDRLQPYDRKRSGQCPRRAFGLTLQTALGASEPFDRKRHEHFLQPWKWSVKPAHVVLIAVDQDGRPTGSRETVKLHGHDEAQEEIRTSGTAAAHGQWHRNLHQRFDRLAKISSGAEESAIEPRWGWPLADREAEVGGEIHPWPAFLGELSLLPWPLPQSLGVSHVFFTDHLGDAERLAAAPVLPADFFAEGSPELWPVPLESDVGSRTVHLEYLTKRGDGEARRTGVLARLQVTAEALPVELAVRTGSSKTFFDFGTLWIESPGDGGNVFRDEWRSALEDRLAEGVHLSAILVEIVEEALADAHAKGDPTLPRLLGDRLPTLARVGVALVANVHGPGIRDGAPGGKLADRVLPKASAQGSEMAKWFYGSEERTSIPIDVPQNVDEQVWEKLPLWRWARRVGELTGDRSAELLLERPETLTIEDVLARLRSLDATLAERATAGKLFDQHWLDFSRGKKAFEREVEGIDWRRQLLLDHLGLLWGKLLASLQGCVDPTDRGCLRRSLQAPMETFVSEHLLAALPEQLHARVLDHLSKVLERAIPDPDAALVDSEEAGRARGRTRGLTFQVDTPMPDPEDGTDYLERIQGFGVMMRRRGKQWRPLNVGRAVVEGDNGSEVVLAERVLVPSRLGYHNDLRQVGLTYDNEPLGLESPLTRASGTYLVCQDEEAAWKERFLQPTVRFKASTKNKIPALAYGAEYQIQPFLVANNGAVPKALAEPVEVGDGDKLRLPWKLRETFPSKLGPSPREASYKRRQRVGPLRPVAVEDGEVAPRLPFTVPEVPAGVGLRARELSHPPEGSANDGAQEEALTIEKGDPAHVHFADDIPCLLLVPKDVARRDVDTRQSFDFAVRPPAVDLQTWDRFLALDTIGDSEQAKTARRRRRRVWAGVYEVSILNTPEDKGEDQGSDAIDQIDATLDDPAVKDVQARLWRVDKEGKMLPVGGSVPFGWEALSVDESQPLEQPEDVREGYFLREHREETKISIGIGEEGLREEGGAIRVSVNAGEVYLLILEAELDADLKHRFAPGVEPFPVGGKALTSPWQLAIEVADALVTQDNEPKLQSWLWEHLQPSHDAARKGRLRVELGVEPEEILARHALRAELRHQSWGWRGRPPWSGKPKAELQKAELQKPHPALEEGFVAPREAAEELQTYLGWELANLGDRHDFERRRVDMLRRRPEKRGDPTAAIEAPFFVFDERLESGGLLDLRAGHHRFGVEVWSRYAPVLAPGKGSVEARDASGSQHPWRSLFVPCRFHGKVPAPKVRLILPLTDHHDVTDGDDDRGAPGWLVVLDEIWFETGGLAEELRVEVVQVISPNVEWGQEGEAPSPEDCKIQDTKKDCAYLQMGPDPIVTGANAFDLMTEDGPAGASASPYTALDNAVFKVEFDLVHGPVGHHRDFSDTAPRFLASSFVVRPPTIEISGAAKALADPAFWLYQVRLERRLHVDGLDDPLKSEPTAPFWIQLLPSLRRLDDDWLGTSVKVALAERRQDGKTHVTFERSVRDQPRDRVGFELYAVVTRLVADVTGSRDQEAYVGVYGPVTADGFAVDADKMPLGVLPSAARDAVTSPFRIRLMEVQRLDRATPSKDEDIWKKLFDLSTGERERARITRVSQPMEVRRS